MKKIQIAVIILFCCISTFGQSTKQDLLMVTKNMSSLKKYSVTLKYSMFLDNNLKTPHSTKSVIINADNANYNMVRPNEMEVIETKNEYLIVDHKSKSVILNRLKSLVKQKYKNEEENEYEEAQKLFETNYDSLVDASTSVKLLLTQDNIKVYEVNYTDNDIKKAIYTIDTKLKIFKSITIVYSEPEAIDNDNTEHYVTMKIDYENFNVNPVISKSVFDPYKYVQKLNDKQYKLKDNLIGYRFQLI